ncbi:hypothetical protein F4780DRAFT_753013 [Xylariomycetidae sp. FL0641]|nr:hypothetical protein F4780DRAFT_753013 [Xylariomycetidae sp. FL0641]
MTSPSANCPSPPPPTKLQPVPTKMPTANITSLPIEILLQITSYVTSHEHGALRLACKQLEDMLVRSFAQRYFTEMQFMRTDFSLQALVDISKSRFAPYLKHVLIGNDLLDTSMAPRTELILTRPRPPPEDRELDIDEIRFNTFICMCTDQLVFINTAMDQQMLVEAFSNLQLDTVGIHACPHWQPTPCARKSYGVTKIWRETGVRILEYGGWGGRDSAKRTSADLLHVLLSALGKAGARPKKLVTHLEYMGLADDAFAMPQFLKNTILPVLHGLEEVNFQVHDNPDQFNRVMLLDGSGPVVLDTINLRRFILECPNLQRLILHNKHRGSNKDNLLRWLADPASDELHASPRSLKAPSSPVLAHLGEVVLQNCRLLPRDVLALVRKCAPNMRKLGLVRVSLVDEGSSPIVYDDDGNPVDGVVEPPVAVWVDFLGDLGRIGGVLDEIYIQEPWMVWHDSYWGLTIRDTRFNQFSYKGPHLRERLQEDLASRIELTKSDHDTPRLNGKQQYIIPWTGTILTRGRFLGPPPSGR